MVGIVSYGVYIPRHRISRATIATHWGTSPMPGEKAVANLDEDSITLGTEAALNASDEIPETQIDSLIFSSTSPPYTEKLSSSVIAEVLDLKNSARTLDITDTLRSSTSALITAFDSINSGLKSVLVVSAECRRAEPGSSLEQSLGDAAAAVVLGEEDTIADIEMTYSIRDEITATWRKPADPYVNVFTDAFFVKYGFSEVVERCAKEFFKKFKVSPKDLTKVIIPSPSPRALAGISKGLGFSREQISDTLFLQVGDVGTALPLLMLAKILEDSNPGDKILLVGYGDGADILLLTVKDGKEKIRRKRGVKDYLADRKEVKTYGIYTKMLQGTADEGESSAVLLWREKKHILSLFGSRCKRCSQVQYPVTRVCIKCGAKDEMEKIKLKRRGKIFTFTHDYLTPSPISPVSKAAIDLEGGGRIFLDMTDTSPEEIKIDGEVELVFRKIHSGGGFHNYFWKARVKHG
jgi:3-hydroxy-3-methylglutaryl CoA synthase